MTVAGLNLRHRLFLAKQWRWTLWIWPTVRGEPAWRSGRRALCQNRDFAMNRERLREIHGYTNS